MKYRVSYILNTGIVKGKNFDTKKQMEDFNEELELAKHDNARMRAELEHERAEVQRDRAFLEADAKRVQMMKADTMFTKDKQQHDMRE